MFIRGDVILVIVIIFPHLIIFEFWRFISFNVYIIFLNCNYSFMFFFVNEGKFWRSINFLIKTKVVYSKVEIIKIVVIFQCPANGVFWRARSWDFVVVLINFLWFSGLRHSYDLLRSCGCCCELSPHLKNKSVYIFFINLGWNHLWMKISFFSYLVPLYHSPISRLRYPSFLANSCITSLKMTESIFWPIK